MKERLVAELRWKPELESRVEGQVADPCGEGAVAGLVVGDDQAVRGAFMLGGEAGVLLEYVGEFLQPGWIAEREVELELPCLAHRGLLSGSDRGWQPGLC